MVRVKICGITSAADALAAVGAGANALGFVFAPGPRCISPEAACAITALIPPFVSAVGVFVDEEPARVREIVSSCGLHYVQFHGDESPASCAPFRRIAIKAVRMRDGDSLRGVERYDVAAFLLDSYVRDKRGGSAVPFHWELAAGAAALGKPIILAGGLTLENVAEAIRAVDPYAVDVSSGVEAAPGKKDHGLMTEFIRRAKRVRWGAQA